MLKRLERNVFGTVVNADPTIFEQNKWRPGDVLLLCAIVARATVRLSVQGRREASRYPFSYFQLAQTIQGVTPACLCADRSRPHIP